jgi:hypothetical protein
LLKDQPTKKNMSALKDYEDSAKGTGGVKSLMLLENMQKSAQDLSIAGTRIEDHEASFTKNRRQMKPFYKNRKFKVITNEGSLVQNSSRDLIERSGTAAGGSRSHRD